jgi:hypothetical protein
MAFNKQRADRFARKSTDELKRIAESGSLAAAAARYALQQRGTVA